MRVQIRSGDTGVEKIGYSTYGEALTLAIDVLRRLECLPPSDRLQLIEVHKGQEMRFRAEVSRSNRGPRRTQSTARSAGSGLNQPSPNN